MKSCRSEGQHYIAPSIGKLRKSMQEQYTRSAFVLEPGFEDMESKFVDIAYVTGAYPGRKRDRRKSLSIGANGCGMCKLLRNRTADRGDCGCEHKATTFTLEYVKDNGTKLHPS